MENAGIDLLGRQEFVDKLIQTSEILSRNKKSVCYAINGAWGVGKSFVLDMFENQIKDIGQEGTTLSKYLVFRYNCWEYDYYEEPLIAIVTSMMDEIDKNVNLVPREWRDKFFEIAKIIGTGLMNKAVGILEEKSNISVKEIGNIIKEGSEAVEKRAESVQEFDHYIRFKRTLKELQEIIGGLAVNQTVVFIVDELDRCLPEYSIKVLERLHHLFDSISNVQVVMAVDKEQLKHVIHQIYGNETDPEKYLAKFIDIELKLTEGSFSDQELFESRFENYFKMFGSVGDTTLNWEIAEFCQEILEGIDIRSRIAILEKCILLHELVSNEEQMDSSFMCIELALMVLKHANMGINALKALVNTTGTPSHATKGIKWLRTKWNAEHVFHSNGQWSYIQADKPCGVVYAACRWLGLEEKNTQVNCQLNVNIIRQYATDYWTMMKTIC